MISTKYISILVCIIWCVSRSSACLCQEGLDIESSLRSMDSVYRGYVIEKLKAVNFQEYYVVRAIRVFKGCAFLPKDLIVVSTASDSAMCGVDLKVNTTYLFSGMNTLIKPGVKKQLATNKNWINIRRAVSIGLCDYNVKWNKIPQEDVYTARTHDNSECVIACTTGTDCASTDTHYCEDGQCKSYDATCAVEAICSDLPCDVTKPCKSATTCTNNFCEGCNAIFVDSTGTRVCKP